MPTKKSTRQKATATKAMAKKPTAKRPTAKKPTAKKVTAKKVTAKKVAAKKVAAKKVAAKKVAAKKVAAPRPVMSAKHGDLIVIDSAKVGSAAREGEILEVIQGEVSLTYRVRWEDGRQTLITPALGAARIVPASGRA